MAVQGEGEYRYEISNDWAKVPPGMEWREVGAVAVDHHDNVYVFNRGPHPMMVFDRDGNFLRSWGEGLFQRAHGAHFAPDEHALSDRRRRPHRPPLHARRQGADDARHSRPAGAVHEPGAVPPLHAHRPLAARRPLRLRRLRQRARPQVSRPTASSCCPGASRARRPASSTCRTTSAATTTAGSTSPIARATACRCSTATAATRPQWHNLHRPSGLYMPPGKCPICYVGECGPAFGVQSRRAEPRAARQHRSPTTARCWRASATSSGAGMLPGQFISPHGIAVDSHGDVYVGEVSATAWPQLKPDQPAPSPLPSLRKLTRLPG